MAEKFPTTSRVVSNRGYITLPRKPKQDDFDVEDFLDNYFNPTTTTTTVPKEDKDDFIQGKEYKNLPTSQALDNSIVNTRASLSGKYDPEVLDRAMAGEKAKPFWQKALFGTLNYGVLKPLQALDTGRRLVVSGAREGIDIFDPNRDASFKDFWKQLTDVNLSSKDVFNINTGNKWVDNVLGFGLDVALDPTTYLTLGTGTAAKIALGQTTKVIAREAGQEAAEKVVQQIVNDAATNLATRGLRGVTDDVSKQIAIQLGEKATAKEIRVASRAAVAEAAQIARQSGSIGDNVLNQAIGRYSAVGPRRGIGAGKREATATAIRETRDAAAREAAQFAGTAQGRRAQQFVDTITDDVIADIATKGFSAMRGDIAKQLGVKGGFRYNIPGVRTSVRGTELITNPIGRATSGIRRAVAGTEVFGSPLARIITPRGMSQAVWDARTGLRTGGFETTEETLNALQVLSKDAQFRGFVNAAKQAVKPARSNILNAGNASSMKTVYQLLDPKIDIFVRDAAGDIVTKGDDLVTKDLVEIERLLGRKVSKQEVAVAKEFAKLGDELTAAIASTGPQIAFRGNTKNWFPQMLTQNAYKFLASFGRGGKVATQARIVLDNLGLETAPLLGQTLELAPGKKFFNTVLPDNLDDFNRLGIDDFNKMARDAGFQGDFFETNAVNAIDKFIKRYADDYALAQMVSYNTKQALDGARPALVGTDPFLAENRALVDRLTSGTLDEIVAADRLQPWAVDDLLEGRRAVENAASRALAKTTDDTLRDSVKKAAEELDEVFRVLKASIDSGDDIAEAWTKLATDLQANYATLFSLPKNKVMSYLKNIGPQDIKTMVKLGEDAFVALDSYVVPDALVRADLVNVFKNVQKLKDPKVANQALELWRGIQNSVRTWYTTSPGFHLRNWLSNWFQMIAGGGNMKYLQEGRKIADAWNQFLKDEAELRGGLVRTPGELVQRFFETANIPKNQRPAAEEALLSFGAAGFGDLEDVFGGAASRAIGVTGREATGVVPLTRGRVQSETLRRASTAAGALPRISRSFGERVETQARFIFTYDAMRQGLTPDEAIARTSKFLVDYTDLSQLDEIARQFIPFWMWMSRNLPTQLVNMYTSPGLYQKYNNFRRNFEDKDGNSELLPSYLSKTGAFVLGQVPGIGDAMGVQGALTLRPDLGFPGAGSPSPLQEGVINPEALLQSANPILRNLVEQGLLDREIFSGQPLETPGQRVESAVEAAVPQLSFIQRVLNPAFAGTDIPGIRDIPGIYSSTTAGGNLRESPDELVKLQRALSFLGIPIGIQGPNERNVARREQLERLGGASYQTQAEVDEARRNLDALQEELRRRLEQQRQGR